MDFSTIKYDSTHGEGLDLKFLYENDWLKNSEVRSNIVERKGRWYVSMIFISVKKPFSFFAARN